jgi:hypothetical protein
MPEIPNLVYWFVGVMVVSNIGTIISVAVVGARGVWWLSYLSSRVEAAENDIEEIKGDVRDLRHSIQS